MRALVIAASISSLLAFAGCASSPSGSTAAAGSGAATEAARIAPPVRIPEAAKRKLVLAMTGPKAVTEAEDWGEFTREWRETFAEHAKQAGIAYAFSDTEPRPTGEDGTILYVDVADYRIVGIGARVFFGVMTGNAHIKARARFRSLRDGSAFGEQEYSTTSSAWGGVLAKVTPQQVDSIASNVFLDLASPSAGKQ